MLAPCPCGKFNDEKSLFLVGAQCLRPLLGASIAPLQSKHLDRASFDESTGLVQEGTGFPKLG